MTHAIFSSLTPQDATATPTVLCVDDDPEITQSIEMHLRPYAVNVVRAFHGMQGFAEAVKIEPDLIIMDVAMPHDDGGSVLGCIRRSAKTADTPVIILTGMRDRAIAREMLALGANKLMRKPANSDDLLHEIGRFIQLRERSGAEKQS